MQYLFLLLLINTLFSFSYKGNEMKIEREVRLEDMFLSSEIVESNIEKKIEDETEITSEEQKTIIVQETTETIKEIKKQPKVETPKVEKIKVDKKENVQPNGTLIINGKTHYIGKHFGYILTAANDSDEKLNQLQKYIDKGYIASYCGPFNVTDGRTTMIGGHNYGNGNGVFDYVANRIKVGDTISAKDWNGNHKNYTVQKVHKMYVYTTTTDSLLDDEIGLNGVHKEGIVIQFCRGNTIEFWIAR